MKMYRLLLAISLILIGAYVFYSHDRRVEPVTNEKLTTEVEKPVLNEDKLIKTKRKRPNSSITKQSKANSTRPKIQQQTQQQVESKDAFFKRVAKDRLVPFEVVGDLAIAYGDVVLGRLDEYQRNVENIQSGFSELPRSRLWPGNLIPYVIDEKVEQKSEIQKALQIYERETNIRFVPSENDSDLIVFTTTEKHCFSHLGRIGGPQPIYLSPECDASAISHEIMHALGFFHEQSRTDRDQYIEIIWQNIDPKYEGQFAMIPDNFMEIVDGYDFDFNSIMLYPPTAFSIDGQSETMESLDESEIAPTKSYFSKQDIQRINRAYPLDYR